MTCRKLERRNYEAGAASGSDSFRGHCAKVGNISSLLKSGNRDMVAINQSTQLLVSVNDMGLFEMKFVDVLIERKVLLVLTHL